LYYLTPFALKVTDAAALNSLYQAHNALAGLWNDDRNLTSEQLANGEANFSDMYLADRAAMLSWMLKVNEKDIADNNPLGYQSGTQGLHFEDKASNTIVDINKILTDKQNYIFGANIGPINTDNLTGGDKADHLYGMVGAGTGTDFLKGGAGNDTYLHNTGDGTDVITDSDGLGSIKSNGITLNGGNKVTGATYTWESADHNTLYTKYDQGDGKFTLNITLKNGASTETIFVKDWVNNQLGITLADSTPPAPPPVLTNTSDMYFASDADEQVDGGDGNDVLIATARQKFTLKGGIGNDLILGYGNTRPLLLRADNPDGSGTYNSIGLSPISPTNHTSTNWQTVNGVWSLDASISTTPGYISGSAYLGSFWTITGVSPQYGNLSLHNSTLNLPLYTYAGAPSNDPARTEITEVLEGGAGNDLISGSMDADYIDGGDDKIIKLHIKTLNKLPCTSSWHHRRIYQLKQVIRARNPHGYWVVGQYYLFNLIAQKTATNDNEWRIAA
jgi:RTX calcium-binding nonapeptide repeat (4 copies)